MSQENVELTYCADDRLNRRDLDGLLALMAKDVRVQPKLTDIEGGYHGHDGIRRMWKSLGSDIGFANKASLFVDACQGGP